jgi:hypothetical protein
MYRYKVSGAGFEFEHKEESGRRLQAGDVIRSGQGPDEYKVLRITKEPSAVFGSTLPLLSSRGVAEAERFVRR